MGLPIAAVFGTKNIKVVGIDVNENRVKSIKNSTCPFYDPSLEKILKEALSSGNLEVATKLENIDKAIDLILVTVGTPSVENNIDYSQLYSALKEISQLNLKGKMLIFRSTVPPGTTSDIIVPFLEYNT